MMFCFFPYLQKNQVFGCLVMTGYDWSVSNPCNFFNDFSNPNNLPSSNGIFLAVITLPETKPASLHLKINQWLEDDSFLLGFGLLSGAFAVSFRYMYISLHIYVSGKRPFITGKTRGVPWSSLRDWTGGAIRIPAVPSEKLWQRGGWTEGNFFPLFQRFSAWRIIPFSNYS